MTEKLTLVAIFAHPDDEAFGAGGTLAKYAQQGVDVHVITATLGEAGQIANPSVTLNEPLSVLREQELRCACHEYGVVGVHMLGYIDRQTAVVPPGGAVYKIVKLLRQLKPQVVISFGPDGVYGHFDHLVIHRWASAAVQIAAESDKWVTAGAPHQVAKFYHLVISEKQVMMMKEAFKREAVFMDDVPFPFVGYPDEQITTVIDVGEVIETKLNGIRCHASQLDPAMPYLPENFDPSLASRFQYETFVLAKCHPPTSFGGGREDDLFVGLR